MRIMAALRWLAAQAVSLLRQFGSQILWVSLLAYLIRESADTFQAFVGRTSSANVILGVAAGVNITVAISVTVSLAASALWLLEYKRHRRTRERLTGRITDLELKLDPGRTSSLLTRQGTTRRGDL
jgi:hypothetical protein